MDKNTAKRRGKKLPTDWWLSLEDYQAGHSEGWTDLEIEKEGNIFLEYYTNGPGRTQTSPDWSRRWKSWVKRNYNGCGKVKANIAQFPKEVSRKKTKGQTLRLNHEAWMQLKYLSIEHQKPAHDLLLEAVNGLFEKHGKTPCA